MSSDRRWAGGLANRTWQAGTRIVPEITEQAIALAVREYRRTCSQYGTLLDPKYHPTADGAAKTIFTYSPVQAHLVREEFGRQIEAREPLFP